MYIQRSRHHTEFNKEHLTKINTKKADTTHVCLQLDPMIHIQAYNRFICTGEPGNKAILPLPVATFWAKGGKQLNWYREFKKTIPWCTACACMYNWSQTVTSAHTYIYIQLLYTYTTGLVIVCVLKKVALFPGRPLAHQHRAWCRWLASAATIGRWWPRYSECRGCSGQRMAAGWCVQSPCRSEKM